MEFLMGRALGNNLINLCCYKEVAEVLQEMGLDINVVEDQEPDLFPSVLRLVLQSIQNKVLCQDFWHRYLF